MAALACDRLGGRRACRRRKPRPHPAALATRTGRGACSKTALRPRPAKDAAGRDRASASEIFTGQLAGKYPDGRPCSKAAGSYFWRRRPNRPPRSPVGSAPSARPARRRHRRRARLVASWRRPRPGGARAIPARRRCPADAAQYHFDLANVLYLFRQHCSRPPALPDDTPRWSKRSAHFRRASELAPGDLIRAAYAETFYVFADPDWQQALAAWKTVLALERRRHGLRQQPPRADQPAAGNRADTETYLAHPQSGVRSAEGQLRQRADATGHENRSADGSRTAARLPSRTAFAICIRPLLTGKGNRPVTAGDAPALQARVAGGSGFSETPCPGSSR